MVLLIIFKGMFVRTLLLARLITYLPLGVTKRGPVPIEYIWLLAELTMGDSAAYFIWCSI